MPELPEVEALAHDLTSRLDGRAVARLDVVALAALKTFEPAPAALSGLFINGVTRHGKFLDIAVDDLHLIVHLARAGWVRWRDNLPDTPPRPGKGPLAARLLLDDDAGLDFTEAGTRKRLAIYVVRQPSDVSGIARLGPDPLSADFTLETFAAILASAGRGQIKGVLRDQSTIAGIGNAYSDEILHVAKMSPFKPAAMPDDDMSQLYEAIGTTLREAIERSDGLGASELKAEKKSGLRVHGRAGETCPVCGDTVREVSFADSALQYCPTCQTGGKLLADRRLSRLLK
ncbi:MAG: Fpg/Nei family DNA glycosylase [Nocardioidaceae bacterium]|nr:Fpg/Nei family DNA glycosylase [Nocardioidaceae bacterium]